MNILLMKENNNIVNRDGSSKKMNYYYFKLNIEGKSKQLRNPTKRARERGKEIMVYVLFHE